MTRRWLLCAAGAVVALAQPAAAASLPMTVPSADSAASPADGAIEAFYAKRANAPLWLKSADSRAAATTLIDLLDRSSLDGLAIGPTLARQARAALDSGDSASAERVLSSALILYVQALRAPAGGYAYGDPALAPRADTVGQILREAASTPSLSALVKSITKVNPIYAGLRDAAWADGQRSGSPADRRVMANLDRARAIPASGRTIIVDTATQRLWMMEDGAIHDSMKVVVGKTTSPTPMIASLIYDATINPYWNVPVDLVRKLIAPRVLDQGTAYLKAKGYEVLSDAGDRATVVPATSVDWKAVADGRMELTVRQLPGPANAMGSFKFGFANASGIYLHDTPEKQLFAEAQRNFSNGCVRLEDAPRLARWLLGADAPAASAPEQHISLPHAVPVYISYLTAQASGDRLTFAPDVYGRDQGGATIASR